MKENWNKDFKNIKFPTIESFLSSYDISSSNFHIVIGKSIDEYPKFTVTFKDYLSHRSHEETEFKFDSFVKEGALKETNCLVLDHSDWLKSMSTAIEFLYENKKLRHFIFAGGDNIVEVITGSDPIVAIVNAPQTFEYKI